MSHAFYRPTGGFFEQVNPSVKVVCLVLAFIPPFLSSHPLHVLPYFGLLLLASLMSGAAHNLRRVGAVMIILFVMSLVLWSLVPRGQTTLLRIGPAPITAESVLYGTTVGLRFNCFVLAAVLFLTCTRIEDFTYGLSRLGVPYVVSFTLSLAFRLTPLFIETGHTIVMAQRARGLDLDSGGLFARLRRYVPIIVPVLVSGLRRADQLAVALESKGFGAGTRRTVLSEYPVTWRDGLLAAVLLLAIVLTFLHRYRAGNG